MKEALYLVHTELDASLLEEWNAFHAGEHVPLVVKQGGFAGAVRWRHAGPDGRPSEPPKFTTAYRATGLRVIREYLEGGEVGKMRAHHEDWLEARGARTRQGRDIAEENYSVDGDGRPLVRTAELVPGRAAFVVRVRLDADAAGTWSTWYDAEHMPAVVRAGSFLRAGRYRIVDESSGPVRFMVVYEAPSADAMAAFRKGPGPRFGAEHEKKFGDAVTVERESWIAW